MSGTITGGAASSREPVHDSNEDRPGRAKPARARPHDEEVEQTQHDHHHRHCELEREAEPRIERDLERDDRAAHEQKGDGVSQTPNRSDAGRPGDGSLATDYRRDSHDVIGIGRMSHPQHQARYESEEQAHLGAASFAEASLAVASTSPSCSSSWKSNPAGNWPAEVRARPFLSLATAYPRDRVANGLNALSLAAEVPSWAFL